MQNAEVETVARAFYYTNENARGWEREPDLLKQGFRVRAHAAVTALDGFRESRESALRSKPEGSVADSVGEARMMDLLRFDPPGFVAVLTGPEHTFHIANNPYRQIVGRRRLTGRPVREALPEVEGQGFFELLDMVYDTGQHFRGKLLPFMVQRRRDRPPEEKLIDLAYEPVIDEAGQRLGILVTGRDVTTLANLLHSSEG